MIIGLDHAAIIVSSEQSVDFYKKLGFREMWRKDRGYDVMVFLNAFGMTLELFVDAKHPAHVTNPEALGLRHLALKVDDVAKTIEELQLDAEPIREAGHQHFTFFKDPDGLPIELHD